MISENRPALLSPVRMEKSIAVPDPLDHESNTYSRGVVVRNCLLRNSCQFRNLRHIREDRLLLCRQISITLPVRQTVFIDRRRFYIGEISYRLQLFCIYFPDDPPLPYALLCSQPFYLVNPEIIK